MTCQFCARTDIVKLPIEPSMASGPFTGGERILEVCPVHLEKVAKSALRTWLLV